jgi:hypothetical protein
MTINLQRTIGICLAAGGLLAVTTMGMCVWPGHAGAAQNAYAVVDDWPEPSQLAARAMIDRHGRPNRRRMDSLTWFGLYGGRRTIVHRSKTSADVVEQVVLYRVPAAKAGEVEVFDGRIKVNRAASEVSARTESAETNFLLLNLAHEIASGFRTVVEAQQFRDKELQLEAAGKSSRYRDRLIFEEPLPGLSGMFVVPSGLHKPK